MNIQHKNKTTLNTLKETEKILSNVKTSNSFRNEIYVKSRSLEAPGHDHVHELHVVVKSFVSLLALRGG